MGDLLKAGQIDAAVIIEPIRSRVLSSGEGVGSIDFVSEVNPHVVAASWGTTRAWATANSATVGAFRAALTEAMLYMHEHAAEADGSEKKYLGHVVPPPELSIDILPADYDFWISLEKQLKLLQNPPPNAADLIIH